ncbi:hypothetical protein Tco_0100419 [Tanacetum coccineum]
MYLFDISGDDDQPDTLANATPTHYSPTPPTKANKGKGIAKSFDDPDLKMIMPQMEQGESTLNITILKRFITPKKGPMTLGEVAFQLQETKRLADLKAVKDKSVEALKRMTPAQQIAQEHRLTEIETKRIKQLNKSRDEYLKCIETRDDKFPII